MRPVSARPWMSSVAPASPNGSQINADAIKTSTLTTMPRRSEAMSALPSSNVMPANATAAPVAPAIGVVKATSINADTTPTSTGNASAFACRRPSEAARATTDDPGDRSAHATASPSATEAAVADAMLAMLV